MGREDGGSRRLGCGIWIGLRRRRLRVRRGVRRMMKSEHVRWRRSDNRGQKFESPGYSPSES